MAGGFKDLIVYQADAEASETTVWLDFSLKCGYLDEQVHRELSAQHDEIGRMLGSMIASP